MSKDITGFDWPADRILPAFQPPRHLTIFDMRGASRDVQLSATVLAGLINRPQPMAYLIADNDDDFWLSQLLSSIPQETAPSNGDAVLDGMLITFPNCVKGMIIYDPNFMDSINIATTMAGQNESIVVTPDQAKDLQQAYNLQVVADLRTHQWRNRLQAYDWARQNLLNEASAHVVAGLDPKITTGVRSFLVASHAFVYWLDSRNFLPDVANNFQSERGLMQEIFKTFPPEAVHLGWFIDEASGVALTSSAAIPVLASDYFNNLELWTSIQPSAALTKAAPAARSEPSVSVDKIYISFTMSDGDNLQYNQHHMLRVWNDHTRGSLPIGWTVSPALMQAAPAMAAYYAHTATANDEFIAGPSGIGYMFPSRWPAEHLPTFLQRTGQAMQRMDLKLLEVLDVNPIQADGISIISTLLQMGMIFSNTGLQQQFIQALLPFGLNGVFSGAGTISPGWNIGPIGVPCYQNLGIVDSVNKALGLVKAAALTKRERPLFLNLYVLVWTMTPSNLKQVIQQLGSKYEVVLPSTLLAMLAKSKQ